MADRAQVADDARIDFACGVALRTRIMLPGNIAVTAAYAKGRGKGKIRQPILLADLFNERGNGARVRNAFTEKNMDDRAAGIFCLKIVLNIEHFHNVVAIMHRQLG